MRLRSLVLVSLVFAPSLLACAAASPIALAPLPPESTVATTVFLETAGMDLTPPSTCDLVVATRALDTAWESAEAVRPACESACRVDTCRAIAVQSTVTMYYEYSGNAEIGSQLATHCEQTVDACVAVTGVVERGEPIDELGLALEFVEDEESIVDGIPVEPPEIQPEPIDPALVTACDEGDAAACFALVDIDMVMNGWDYEGARELSLARWEQACDLEPRVYCRGLATAIDYTTDEGCGG